MRLLALSIALVSLATSQTEREAKPSQEIMWKKLDLAHDSLDAIALDDFEALEAYASDLSSLSLSAGLALTETEGYRRQSREFREAAQALLRAARKRDTEEAALAYVDLTLRCLGCHRALGEKPPR
jgi:hypothetical protein